jgi:hypothetical protein
VSAGATLPFSLEHASLLLARTPVVLRAWLTDVPHPWIHGNEGPDTFSPHEVVGHLVHGEQVDWIARARMILEEGPARTFDPFDRFAHRRLFAGKTVSELLDLFATLRSENLAVLRGWRLTDAQLDRAGRHPELGPVTLRQLVATWVVHDLGHIGQIARVMATQYAVEVGPWHAYLPVLHRCARGP